MGHVRWVRQGWWARRLPHGRGVTPGCASLGALAAGLLLAGCDGGVGAGPEDPAQSGPPAVPRTGLVVRGHTQPVAGTLTGGTRVSGTLYPALPGANTLYLRVENPGSGGAGMVGRAEVAASMPGMAMRPAMATLVGRAGGYQGTIALPMFGHYAARIVMVTRQGRRQGTLRLDVPLAPGT